MRYLVSSLTARNPSLCLNLRSDYTLSRSTRAATSLRAPMCRGLLLRGVLWSKRPKLLAMWRGRSPSRAWSMASHHSFGADGMGRLAGFKHRNIVKKLRRLGWVLDRQAAGSHEIWRHGESGLKATIPNHPGDMPEGTLRAILRQGHFSIRSDAV